MIVKRVKVEKGEGREGNPAGIDSDNTLLPDKI